MAIEIIRHGKIENVLWTGTCGRCGCEITAHDEDLDVTYGDFRNDNIPYASKVRCPEEFCNGFISMTIMKA